MPANAPSLWTHPVRLSELKQQHAFDFDICPAPDQLGALAERLDLSALKKLRFAGKLVPMGKQDWRLDAELGATVVQPCVVTLAPVTTRLDEPVTRQYLADFAERDPEPGSEVEIPEDDSSEPLPATLDLAALALEELALSIPDWPRATGAELNDAQFTEPGKTAMQDEDAKPFAGLKALRDKLDKDG